MRRESAGDQPLIGRLLGVNRSCTGCYAVVTRAPHPTAAQGLATVSDVGHVGPRRRRWLRRHLALGPK